MKIMACSRAVPLACAPSWRALNLDGGQNRRGLAEHVINNKENGVAAAARRGG